MGYSHIFYGLDLEKLRSACGSGDEALVQAILKAHSDDFVDEDGPIIEDDADPELSKEDVLREIITGNYTQPDASHVYGYMLMTVCEHLGQDLGDYDDDYAEVGNVYSHPYNSQLCKSGPPIKIPVSRGDYPMMGYLAHSDIQAEIDRIKEAPEKPPINIVWLIITSPLLLLYGIGKLLRRNGTGMKILQVILFGMKPDLEGIKEDMDDYQKILNEALEEKVDIVSFRH